MSDTPERLNGPVPGGIVTAEMIVNGQLVTITQVLPDFSHAKPNVDGSAGWTAEWEFREVTFPHMVRELGRAIARMVEPVITFRPPPTNPHYSPPGPVTPPSGSTINVVATAPREKP